MPREPGPVISPKTLTNENAPLIIPKPRPDTNNKAVSLTITNIYAK